MWFEPVQSLAEGYYFVLYFSFSHYLSCVHYPKGIIDQAASFRYHRSWAKVGCWSMICQGFIRYWWDQLSRHHIPASPLFHLTISLFFSSAMSSWQDLKGLNLSCIGEPGKVTKHELICERVIHYEPCSNERILLCFHFPVSIFTFPHSWGLMDP